MVITADWQAEAIKFQFPSNGKADPKPGVDDFAPGGGDVSIPFKRESGSKGGRTPSLTHCC